MTDTAAVREAVAGLEALDILVNNAGVNQPQPFLEVDEETLDRLLGLNVRAAFLVAQAAARRMVAQGGGVIVNVSSQMGHVGSERDRTVYVMAKHAIEGLTKAMAAELAPKGVRVVAIAPTFITTPLTEPFFRDAEFRKWVVDRIPLGRIGTVDEVAAAIVFWPRRRRRSSPGRASSSTAAGPPGECGGASLRSVRNALDCRALL